MKKILLKLTLLALPLVSFGTSVAYAEEVQLRCFYTEVSYSAPFMPEPQVRECPESRCYYDISWDADTGAAMVNGLDYSFSANAERVMLVREAENPVMGGIDKASFSIEQSSLAFRSIRLTSPDVKLTLEGQCEAF